MITKCSLMGNLSFTLCSIYGSILDDPGVFNLVRNKLEHWPLPIIFCGDFNINLLNNWELHLKYVGRKPIVFQSLLNICGTHMLIDVWAKTRPSDHGLTYFSAPYSKHCRLNCFLVSASLQQDCRTIRFPRFLSDHNPLVLEIVMTGITPKTTVWTFERALLRDEGYREHMRAWIPEILNRNAGTAPLVVVGDSFKAAVWGGNNLICFEKREKREVQGPGVVSEISTSRGKTYQGCKTRKRYRGCPSQDSIS